MRKLSKQISKGHITDIMTILIVFFSISFKTTLILCLFLLLFSLNFDLTIFTYWCFIKYWQNLNWKVLLLAKLGKPCLPQYL